MLDFFYTIIIYPVILILEFSFTLSHKLFKKTGFLIIFISFVVSFICLPLYSEAEKQQQIERNIRKKLKSKIDKINKIFSGDEQYMILSVFYRQNHYHPVYSLRSSFGLLVQIPFFIAAYSFLSHLEILKDVKFIFINDLGAPNSLLFLVLLYNSPSALVLYWTINNIFSVFKNIYYKIKYSKKHIFLFVARV